MDNQQAITYLKQALEQLTRVDCGNPNTAFYACGAVGALVKLALCELEPRRKYIDAKGVEQPYS
jgi:hypothetical protein